MAFSITVNSFEPQPIQLNFLQHWVTMLSLSLLRSHRPEPLSTALLPSPQEPGKAPQNRVSTGFREEISEESWHLHCGYAYLLLCHRQRFPQIKCTKLHDRGNTWPKTAKWTQPGHGKRLQRWETKNNQHLYLLLFHTFLSSALLHLRDTQYDCRSPTFVRKSMIEQGRFSEYVFPLILVVVSWKAGRAFPLLLSFCAIL